MKTMSIGMFLALSGSGWWVNQGIFVVRCQVKIKVERWINQGIFVVCCEVKIKVERIFVCMMCINDWRISFVITLSQNCWFRTMFLIWFLWWSSVFKSFVQTWISYGETSSPILTIGLITGWEGWGEVFVTEPNFLGCVLKSSVLINGCSFARGRPNMLIIRTSWLKKGFGSLPSGIHLGSGQSYLWWLLSARYPIMIRCGPRKQQRKKRRSKTFFNLQTFVLITFLKVTFAAFESIECSFAACACGGR